MFILPVTRDTRHLIRLVDEPLARWFNPAGTPSGETADVRRPPTDVAENAQAYTVRMDLPGLNREEIQVSIEGRMVHVQARAANSADHDPIDRPLHRERPEPDAARRLHFPLEIDAGRASAKLENGVLTLVLPKREAHSAAQITIN